MYDFTNNTLGLINVLEFCRKRSSGIIFWSTNKVYNGNLCNLPPVVEKDTRFEWANPDFILNGWSMRGFSESLSVDGGNHTIYGVSKLSSDLFCQEWASAFNVPVVVNRFSCLYGPHQFGMVSQGWIVWFVLAKLMSKELTFYGFNGRQVRDFLHIDDLYSLISLQIDRLGDNNPGVYNVGGGCENTVSVFELSQKLDEMIGVESKIRHGDPRKEDQKIFISDIGKVSKEFNWTPKVSLDDGLNDVIKWLKTDDLSWLKK